MPKVTYQTGSVFCSEPGCHAPATHTCDFQGCGRPLCGMHLRDLNKPIQQDLATASRAGITHLGGIYCQEHATAVGQQAQNMLRLNSALGFVGAVVASIFGTLWYIVSTAVKEGFRDAFK